MTLTGPSALIGRLAHQLRPATGDRWLLWPSVVMIATLAVLPLLPKLPGTITFMLFPVLLLVYPPQVGLCIAAVVFAAKRRYRMAASVLAALLIVILFGRSIPRVTDYLYLSVKTGYGAGQAGTRAGSE